MKIFMNLNVGCDKVSINSSAVSNPDLINESSKRFGSQCIVVAIDVKEFLMEVICFCKRWREDTGLDAVKWAKEVYDRGAGEILLTSMDTDGAKTGFELNMTKQYQNL